MRRPTSASSSASASPNAGDHLLARVDEQAGDPLAQQHRVLGDHHSHGSTARRIVGPPGGLSRWMRAAERRRRARAGRRGRCRVSRVGAAARRCRATSITSVSPTRTSDTAALVALRVAGHVGERLRHDEVRGALDLGRRARIDARPRARPGSARGRRPPTARRRGRGPRGSPGGCRARGRGAPAARPWPPRARARRAADRVLVLVVEVLPRRAQLHRQATSRCCAPSCRSRSMRRRSASALPTAATRPLSATRTRASCSARSSGPRNHAQVTRSSRPSTTVTHGASSSTPTRPTSATNQASPPAPTSKKQNLAVSLGERR